MLKLAVSIFYHPRDQSGLRNLSQVRWLRNDLLHSFLPIAEIFCLSVNIQTKEKTKP
jgi:hypothetical protein